jgi:ElaB/YqjD/DUF883 family membrane-anchored ribosome-binding protein
MDPIGATRGDALPGDPRHRAADTIERAAEGLHRTADRLPGGPRVTEFAHSTADRLGATATYVRDHRLRDVLSDIESFIKAHPAEALAVAAVAGFFAGRALRRR